MVRSNRVLSSLSASLLASRNLLERFFVVLGVLLLSANVAFTQSGTTSLRGTVVDQSGGAIADAAVALSSSEMGVNLATHTDKNGFYQFQEVRPGSYDLTVTAQGFATSRQARLVLLVATPTTYDVRL